MRTAAHPFRLWSQGRRDDGGKGSDPASTLAIGVSLMYAAVFTIAGTHLNYFPAWLDCVGLSARETAVIVAPQSAGWTAGHLPPLEGPDRFAYVVRSFLADPSETAS